jgi:hypothetical protein
MDRQRQLGEWLWGNLYRFLRLYVKVLLKAHWSAREPIALCTHEHCSYQNARHFIASLCERRSAGRRVDPPILRPLDRKMYNVDEYAMINVDDFMPDMSGM